MPATLYLCPTNNNLVFPLPICQRANVDPDSFSKLAYAKISLNEAHNLCIQLLGKDKKESRKIIHKFLDIEPSKEELNITESTRSEDNMTNTKIPNNTTGTTINDMEITNIEDKTGEDDGDKTKEGRKDKDMEKQNEGEDGKNKNNDKSYIDAIKKILTQMAFHITV
eukprot:4208456-Ditylum_brightwellii.AAC.1